MRPQIVPLNSIFFRFVNKSSTIREDFVSFLECSYGFSGQSLFKTTKEFSDGYGIDISDCRGQGYDGSVVVSGKTKV